MEKALIKIAFRQVIDQSAQGSFEKDVFEDTYNEFLMQAQAYNPEGAFSTLHEMIANNPKANSLQYKVGFSIGLYVRALQNKIPGLYDSMGREITFGEYNFEMLYSDISNKSAHLVSLTYTTEILTFLGNIGEYMLLANGNRLNVTPGESTETFLLKIQEGLGITYFAE